MKSSTNQLYCVLVFFAALDFSQGRKHAKSSAHGSGVVCPEAETIAPCECYFGSRTATHPTIECHGDFKLVNLVTQETLNNLFKQLRAVNNLALNDILELHYIRIYRAWKLTELDLTPFLNLKINKIDFETYFVTKLLGPSPPNGKIQVTEVDFYGVLLSDEGLGDALKYFDTSSLRDLRFNLNAFSGGHYPLSDGSGDVEFLPGLSKFTNLEILYVTAARRGKIIEVSGGQFKRNIRLRDINMHGNWNNKLIIGQNAFIFGQSPPELENIPIKYAGRYSTIENADDPQVGSTVKEPPSFSRPVELDYSFSNIYFLKEQVYKPFLDGHPNNSIILKRLFRGLICDERMKWLKNNSALYEHRVLDSACINDPYRRSIFETDLIQT